MRCIVLFYTFCLYFLLLELFPTGSSGVRRLIGGKDADEDKYQYIVRLQYQLILILNSTIIINRTFHTCTAAVLTPIWSLTASHCYLKKIFVEKKKNSISLRPVIMYGPLERRAISIVINMITHPAYSLRMYDLSNDIALIKHEPITLKNYARVSGLDHVTMIGHKVTLTGYGITNTTVMLGTANAKLTEIVNDTTTLGKPLQFLDAIVVQCEKYAKLSIKGGMCLARLCGEPSSLCPGDSGGPVLHESGVVAVNSIGTKQNQQLCYLKPHKAFYDPAGGTPTSPYIDWISKIINNGNPKR